MGYSHWKPPFGDASKPRMRTEPAVNQLGLVGSVWVPAFWPKPISDTALLKVPLPIPYIGSKP